MFPKKKKIPNFFPKTTFHPIFCLQKGPFFPREKQPLLFLVAGGKPFVISLKTSSKDVFLKGF